MILSAKEMKQKANDHRKTILKVINMAGKGHVGGAFSCIDLLTALYYGDVLRVSPQNIFSPDHNRFILSKGHASIAQYVVLQDLGFFEHKELLKMNNGGILGEHPDTNIPGIDFISGSLGHGLAVALGFSLAARADNLDYSTYVVMGDGECAEGSVWEALSLASHLKLTNLVTIIDRNRLCIHGNTEDIHPLDPLEDRLAAFGWNVITIDGHNIGEIIAALKVRHRSKPTAVIAETIKGKGVSFMENQSAWHHGAINDDILKRALSELE